MGAGLINCLKVDATPVSNRFIDRYMAAANGEYVKVYLYLLRHEGEPFHAALIADALDCTEADVRRALSYWRRQGVLGQEGESGEAGGEGEKEADRGTGAASEAASREKDITPKPEAGREQDITPKPEAGRESGAAPGSEAGRPAEDTWEPGAASRAVILESGAARQEDFAAVSIPDPSEGSAGRMERLSGDEDFSTLLYAAQQYLGKTFTSLECEKFAYLYDGLHMSAELLEYLAEYCAQIGKTSIRYVEKVALNWYQTGILAKAQAEDYTMLFSGNVSSVMKAFGLRGRNPGTSEQEFLKRWFYTYGFDRELVTEACNRTIKATQTPSFPYADKILSDWKNSGVKTMRDVEALDRDRKASKGHAKEKDRQPGQAKRSSPNRFNNFEGRSYDYESLVWDDIRKRQQKGGADHGTQ